MTLLNNLPDELAQMTDGQRRACVDFYKSLTLAELRQRQYLCHAQTAIAYEQRNDRAMSNLAITDDLLAQAVGEAYT